MDIAWNGSEFFAIINHAIMASTDGINWDANVGTVPVAYAQSLTSHDGNLVVVGSMGSVIQTTLAIPSLSAGSVSTTENTAVSTTLNVTAQGNLAFATVS